MAFSMLLLVVAGLFGRALVRARTIDPGFDPRYVQVATLDLGLANHDSLTGRQFADRLVEGARAIPGVETAALSRMLPLDGGGLGLGGIEVPGREAPDPRRGWDEDWNVVSPGYFDVMRIPIVSGRAFSDADRAGGAEVAILNETFARRLWPDEVAVGKVLRNEGRTLTVIGVARDSKYRSLGESPRAFIYVPLAQRYMSQTSLLVRHSAGVSVAAPLRRLVAELDPTLPVLNEATLESHTAIGLFPQRVALWVASGLGGVALLLAVIGIYGVTAYGVAQRTREIGIRIALGSPRASVLNLVLGQGVRLGLIGVALGVGAAIAAAGLLKGMLYGVPGTDLVALGVAGGLLMLAALVASWLPARRAARVDPMVALRAE
jgi:predicted permease